MLRIKTSLDILTYIVAGLSLVPLFSWLDLPVQVIVVGSLGAGIISDRRQRYLLGARLATLLALIFFFVYLAQLNMSNVVAPAVNLLALLLSIRLVTQKQARHYLQIFVLALFCLAGSSLLSLSMLYLPALILMLVGVTVGLVLLTFFQRDPSLRLSKKELYPLLKTASVLPLGSMILMLGLFFILPRTQYPMWNFLNSQPAAVTGFSEQVRPGTFASNTASGNLAFRAECAQLAPEQLYWRGTVLDSVSGGTWKRSDIKRAQNHIEGGKRVLCTITLPKSDKRFLFTLDYPLNLEGVRHEQHPDLVFNSRRPLRKGISYTCTAKVGGTLRSSSEDDAGDYLGVPQDVSRRIKQVAERVRQQAPTPLKRLSLVEDFFRAQNLTYANTDLPGPDAPIDEFLFDKKRGYCEFFASSYAILLRLCEVPARLVGGYHGGEYNNFGDYYLISEDMAHVWVEALIDGEWRRLDPSRFAVNASTSQLGASQGLSLIQRSMDGLEFLWTQVVITYDFKRQLDLVRNGGQLKQLLPDKSTLIRVWTTACLLLIGVAFLILWRKKHRSSPQQRLLEFYQQTLLKHYKLEHIHPATGLLEQAKELDDPRCLLFAQRFSAILYGKDSLTEENYRELKNLIQSIRQGDNNSA